jgi:hypothetical protein
MEKRNADRHRVLKAGTIEFGGAAINCMVRNMSITGAALDVASPVGIPDQFTLVLSRRLAERKTDRRRFRLRFNGRTKSHRTNDDLEERAVVS